MVSDSSSTTARQVRLNAGWLALLPTFPVLSIFALGSLRWHKLHPQVRLVFAVFAATQLTAALLTPAPLLSLLLATARTLLLLGLIGVGSRLQARHLSWMLVGLVAVYITAYADALLGQRSSSLLNIRLLHPFLTPPSLGLAGAFGVLICVAVKENALWWRVPIGLLAFSVCLLSGSRSPLLGLLAALLVVLVGRRQRGAALVLGGMAFLAITAAGNLTAGNVLERYATISNSDRDLIWANTLSVVAAHPLGGVGPYQLGESLLAPSQACELWPSLSARGISCPQVITRLRGAWLIAHNLMLHPLAETGFIGLCGYVLLLGLTVPLLLRSAPLVAGIGAMLLVSSLVDNVLLVPSPFFAEAFWISLGIAQASGSQEVLVSGDDQPTMPPRLLVQGQLVVLIGLTCMAVYLFPLWTSLRPHATQSSVQLVVVNSPRLWARAAPYPVYVLIRGMGKYRVVVRACEKTCRTLSVQPANLDDADQHTWDGWTRELVPFSGTQPTELRLELYALNAPPFAIQPLLRRAWTVTPQ